MNQKTMTDTEVAFVNACLEHGATVTIGEESVVVTNPSTGATNTKDRLANTQTYDTPARAAAATCSNLGLDDPETESRNGQEEQLANPLHPLNPFFP